MYFKRIRELRVINNLTQTDMAKILICNQAVYGRYERGLREIPVSMLIKLAEYYDESIDYILGLSDIKRHP